MTARPAEESAAAGAESPEPEGACRRDGSDVDASIAVCAGAAESNERVAVTGRAGCGAEAGEPDAGAGPVGRDAEPAGSAGAAATAGRPTGAWARVAAALVGLAVAGLVLLLATRDTDGGGIRAASPLIGEVVPPLSGNLIWPPDPLSEPAVPGVQPDAQGSAQFDIDALAGRWVLVNFFASWCVPCEREHPALTAWAARHRFDGALVAVPFGDRTQDAVAFYERLGGDWPVVEDADSRWAVAFGVLRPPESFLVTPDGVVAARWQGQIAADDPDALIDLLLGAAAGTAPAAQPDS